jgi:hypothetical protein
MTCGSAEHQRVAAGRCVASLVEVVRVMKLAPDILAQIEKDFGPHARRARQRLEAYSGPETLRVLRCVLFLAKGEIDFLPDLIVTDYRDLIFWAEYVGHASPHPRKVRDFNEPFDHYKIRLGLPLDVRRCFEQKRKRAKKRPKQR